MVWTTLKWLLRLVVFTILAFGMWGCTMLGLNYSSLETANKPAAFPDLADGFEPAEVRAIFETELYGPWPGNLTVTSTAPKLIDGNYLGGRGTLEEFTVTIGEGEDARTFPVVLALPRSASSDPVPLMISLTFSGNCSVFPGAAVTGRDGAPCVGSEMDGTFGWIATQIFGSYIAEAPIERYFDAGIGYASASGSSIVPDRNGPAQSTMRALSPGPAPTSALMSWAFGYEAIASQLALDQRIKPRSISALGHSRYGKSALIAAAWSDDIDAAIAHQSGFGGASSSRSSTGETLARMANSYPHWLRPNLGDDLKAGLELTLDQHFLLALAAPKPIFLGNGRRDVWSDPNSSYRLAEAASLIYRKEGRPGLTATGMQDFRPGDDISFWLRVGGHSVVSEDIDAFIAFKTAHFGG